MDAKLDAYEGFDPTLIEGGGCSCEGGVYWDMITQTWKQGKVAAPKASADCSQVEAALKQAQADKAKADEKAAKAEEAKTAAEEKATEAAKALDAAKEAEAKATADKEAAEAEAETARLQAANANVAKDQAERDKEAAQAAEASAIAKADKAKEDLNVTIAELVTKQNELTAKDEKIAELEERLKNCQKDNCPEVEVVSLGDETVFRGNSCDEVVGLEGGTSSGDANTNLDHL